MQSTPPESRLCIPSLLVQGDALLRRGERFLDQSPPDEAAAAEVFREGAQQGHAGCQFMLAECYAEGKGVTRDRQEAVRLLRLAAEQGDLDAQCNLGVYLVDAGEHVEAFGLWLVAAKAGHSQSQCHMGTCYKRGVNVAVDLCQAMTWWSASAAQGNKDALFSIGMCLASGAPGVPINLVGSSAHLRLAAEKGHAQAQHNMGVAYENGRGVSCDLTEAMRWYRFAALQGHSAAQLRMGLLLEDGVGAQNAAQAAIFAAQAAIFYRMAAHQGNRAAAYYLATLYDEGNGVEQDECKAVHWYHVAADLFDCEAQYELAFAYETGKGGLPIDIGKAVHWYTQAAEEDSDAQFRLGELYEAGVAGFFQPDLLAAVSWYCKAAAASPSEEGPSSAIERLLKSNDLRVAFVIGGALQLPDKLDDVVKQARCLRRRSSERARRAALCWMWARLLPQHDVMVLIGRAVYASRRDPAVWCVSLNDAPEHSSGLCLIG